MNKAVLGKTPQGKEIPIDVTRLLETRMLVTAASGNGKSRTLRRIAEQTAPLVQQFIFDPEGEFASLRERFDYVICAPSGADAVATPRTAALLARRLLESGVSAILDIYDLKPMERHAFVKNFLEAMINAPKDLWKPVLIILDEAHMFAPQNADCQSTAAVIDMATRGRKRGFCLMPATQRLSKLHKDVAAEMLNKMIGGIELDVDVKRASDDLGKTFKEGRAMLRNLDPGQFYIYGPALVRDITLVKVGDVATTHPGPGQRTMKAPPAPSARVMKLLGELADLPQQAVEEAKTMQEAQVQIRDMQRKLGDAEKRAAAGGTPEAELKAIRGEEYKRGYGEGHLVATQQTTAAAERELAQATKAAQMQGYLEGLAKATVPDEFLRAFMDDLTGFKRIFDDAEAAHIAKRQELTACFQKLGKLATDAGKLKPPKAPVMDLYPRPEREGAVPAPTRPEPAPRALAPAPVLRPAADPQTHGDLEPIHQRILDALVMLEGYGITPTARTTLAAMIKSSPNSSGFSNNLGKLRTSGLLDYPSAGMVSITDAGRALANPPAGHLSLSDFHEGFLGIIDPILQRILQACIDVHPKSIERPELAEKIGVSVNSSGFSNNLGKLRTMGVITYPTKGEVRASALLFPEGLA